MVEAGNLKFGRRIRHEGRALTTKMQNWLKGVVVRSRDVLLSFWDTLHISSTVEGEKFKFGVQIGHEGY